MTRTKTTRTLAARYFDLLRGEGYRPKMNRSDDLHTTIPFKSEGQAFLLFVDEDDPGFFHLGIGFELAPEWQDVAAATERANELNAELKVVKVTIHPQDRSARFHVEAFLEGPASMETIARSIDALRNGARQFFAVQRERPQLDA
jgi:hypothetical protein